MLNCDYKLSAFEEVALAALLDARYDDGFVRAQNRDDRKLRKKAVTLGLVDPNGYITQAGHAYWARWEEHRRVSGSVWS
ncbi:MAG: hypothetical protein AAF493_09560 [Pseudomonadota bacterium]